MKRIVDLDWFASKECPKAKKKTVDISFLNGWPYLPTLAYKHKALFANMLVNDDRRVYEASIQI